MQLPLAAKIVPDDRMLKAFMCYLSGLAISRRREGLSRIAAEASPGQSGRQTFGSFQGNRAREISLIFRRRHLKN